MKENDSDKGVDVDKATRAVLDAQIRALRGWRPWMMIVTLIGAASLAFAFIGLIVEGDETDWWVAFLCVGVAFVGVGSGAAIRFRKHELKGLQKLWNNKRLWPEEMNLDVQPTGGETGSDS